MSFECRVTSKRTKSIICLIFILALIPANNLLAGTAIDILAKKIVRDREPNDTKVFKIETWVRKNVAYRSDKKQFNMNDRWTLPMETLQRRKGDCEDGAILIMSLASTAGVPDHRLRMYAPIVTPGGLHACVAYMRESDDQWVWVEWTTSRYRSLGPIGHRPTTEQVSVFLPIGDYLAVTSLNPFNMDWLVDQEWRDRSDALLKNK